MEYPLIAKHRADELNRFLFVALRSSTWVHVQLMFIVFMNCHDLAICNLWSQSREARWTKLTPVLARPRLCCI